MAGPVAEVGRQAAFRAVLTTTDTEWTRPLADWLSPHGVEVVWARTGPEVVEIAESRRVHLAVLDRNVPRLDGLRVLRLMWRSGLRVPAVLISGSSEPEFLAEALRWNAYSVVRKPVDLEVLSNTVSRVFRRFYGVTWA